MSDDPTRYHSDTAVNSEIVWVRHPTRTAGPESERGVYVRPTDPVELAARYFIVSGVDLAEIRKLRDAGWTHEFPRGNQDPEPFEWQWRRPGKRGGRLFRSTSQAYNALMRSRTHS